MAVVEFGGRQLAELRVDHAVEVDPQSGAARLRIPVPAPHGRAGFGPALAIEYAAGTTGSPFAAGWALSGLPTISIDTRDGVPRWDGSETYQLAGEPIVPWLERAGATWRPRMRIDAGFQITLFRMRSGGASVRVERWTEIATGRVHFRARDAQNVLTIFGARPAAASRIADPGDERRTLVWLPEIRRAPDGNAVWMEYAAEDLAGIDRSRSFERRGPATAQRYIKRIRYGNSAPLALDADSLAGTLPGGTRWAFQLVFDYGDHSHAETPSATPDRAWRPRLDPTSSCRAGFDVRTYRLCERVLSFHDFPELDAAPVLVSALVFDHAPAIDGTTLRAVRVVGHRRDPAGASSAELPPLRMTYAPSAVATGFVVAPVPSQINVPAGLDGRRTMFVDLFGEGLPGLLSETDSAWFWKANLGGGAFGAQTVLLEKPTARPGMFGFDDCDRDGDTDFAQFAGRLAGYFELDRSRGQWDGFRPFSSMPHVEALGGRAHWVDLNGDGRVDIVVASADHFIWYPSEGEGFGAPIEVPRPPGMPPLVDDPALDFFFADMNGDGLADLVRVQNGRVEYWPNQGNGRFGASIVFEDSPQFESDREFDASRLRFVDLDGSGTMDLVYIGAGEVRTWINAGGNRLAAGQRIRGLPFIDRSSSPRILDFLGDGRPCLVWSSTAPGDASPIEYLPLTPAVRPRLLEAIDDSMGRETRLSYANSSVHYLRDQAAGRPWSTKLPSHCVVVERRDDIDRIAGTQTATRFEFHDGMYDGVERVFRGFGQVDVYDAVVSSDTLAATPALTRTWFHLGVPMWNHLRPSDTYVDPGLATLPTEIVEGDLAPGELEEALRLVAGSVIRREVYAIDATGARAPHPIAVEQACQRIRKLQPREGGARAVFHAVPEESLTATYEGAGGDPRVQGNLVLEVDDYDQVTRDAAVAYPRRAGVPRDIDAQGDLRVVIHAHVLTHVDDDARYELGIPVEGREYEITGLSIGAGRLTRARLSEAAVQTAIANARRHDQDISAATVATARLLSWDRTYFWNDARTAALGLGAVGERVLVHHEESAVFSPEFVADVFAGRVDGARVAGLGYVLHDGLWWQTDDVHLWGSGGFDLRAGLQHGDGTATRFGYDPYHLELVVTTDAKGHQTVGVLDYHVLEPIRITDPNGAVAEVRYDALGVVTVSTRLGRIGATAWGMDALAAHVPRTPADTAALLADPERYLQGATTFVFYDMQAWTRDGTPPCTVSLTRETLLRDGLGGGAAGGRIGIQIAYFDGIGRVLQHKTLVDPGDAVQRDGAGRVVVGGDGQPVLGAAAERWRASGHTVFDAKQRPVRTFEPFFTPAWRYEGDVELQQFGIATTTLHDAIGRPITRLFPNGTLERSQIGAWSVTRSDTNDTVETSTYRLLREGRPADDPERQAYEHARAHRDTATTTFLDPRGLEVAGLARGGTTHDRRTEVRFDIEGQPVSTTDPRGLIAFSYRRDMQGRPAFTHSIDAGDSWTLLDADDRTAMSWDARGYTVEHTYDELDRPKTTHVLGNGLDHVVEERVYGDELANLVDARERNLIGRLAVLRDQAGVMTLVTADPDGQAVRSSLRLRTDLGEPDWRAAPTLGETFATQAEYDALGRGVRSVLADGSIQTIEYHRDGSVARSTITTPGGTPLDLADYAVIDETENDARGHRTRMRLGNGVEITQAYDRETGRLAQQRAVRGTRTYQNVSYTWDPVGNLVRLHDRAHDPGPAAVIKNVAVPARRDFVYDAHYRLVQATGRVHQALLERDYIPGTAGGMHHARHLSLDNGAAVERYTQRYEYDASGNLHALRHAGDTRSWATTLWVSTTSNRALSSLDPNGTAVTNPESRFDANGHLLRMDHLRDVRWSWRGTLDEAVVIERADGDADNERYTYDANNQRTRKVATRVVHGGDVEVVEKVYLGGCERKIIRRGANVILERWTIHVSDGSGRVAVVHRWITDPGGRETPDTARPRVRFQLSTHQGSGAIELDEDGELLSYEEYFPYGGTAFIAGDAVRVASKEYRYCGKERDSATSLYYYGYRYFAPWIGRWLSPDPIGPEDDLNLYQFVLGDPVGNVDPDGLQTSTPGGTILDVDQAPPPGYFPTGITIPRGQLLGFNRGTGAWETHTRAEWVQIGRETGMNYFNYTGTASGSGRGRGGRGSGDRTGSGSRDRGSTRRRTGAGTGSGGSGTRSRRRGAGSGTGSGSGSGRTGRGRRGSGAGAGTGDATSSGTGGDATGAGTGGDATGAGTGGDGSGTGTGAGDTAGSGGQGGGTGTGTGTEGDGPGAGTDGTGTGANGSGSDATGDGSGAGSGRGDGTGRGDGAGSGSGDGNGSTPGTGSGATPGNGGTGTHGRGDGDSGRGRAGGDGSSGRGVPGGVRGGVGTSGSGRSGTGRATHGAQTGPSGTGTNSGGTTDPNLAPSATGNPAPPGTTRNGTDPNGSPTGTGNGTSSGTSSTPGGRPGGTPGGNPNGSTGGQAGGNRSGGSGGNPQGDPNYREGAWDTVVRFAGYANFEFGGSTGRGQRGGVPGGRGSLNLGWFGQALYVGLTIVSWIGPGAALKGLRLGGRLALRGASLAARGTTALVRVGARSALALGRSGARALGGLTVRGLAGLRNLVFARGRGALRTFVGDSGLWASRLGPGQRAVGDAILRDAGSHIIVPRAVLGELNFASILARGAAGRSAREQFMRMLTTRARLTFVNHPPVPSGAAGMLSAKFGLNDLRVVLTGAARNVPVVTGNRALVNQVVNHAGRAAATRTATGGATPIYAFGQKATDAIQSLADLIRLIP